MDEIKAKVTEWERTKSIHTAGEVMELLLAMIKKGEL